MKEWTIKDINDNKVYKFDLVQFKNERIGIVDLIYGYSCSVLSINGSISDGSFNKEFIEVERYDTGKLVKLCGEKLNENLLQVPHKYKALWNFYFDLLEAQEPKDMLGQKLYKGKLAYFYDFWEGKTIGYIYDVSNLTNRCVITTKKSWYLFDAKNIIVAKNLDCSDESLINKYINEELEEKTEQQEKEEE